MPKTLSKDEKGGTDTYAKFVAEPFEAGYGHTVGNSLRRVLLSSLEGAAITAVKITGAQHEFATLPGVVEDVTDIVLNLKRIKFKATEHEPFEQVTLAHAPSVSSTAMWVVDPSRECSSLATDSSASFVRKRSR